VIYASLRFIYEKCKIIINTSLLTTAGSRPAARPDPGRTTGSCVTRAAHLARMCGLPCAAAHAARVSLALGLRSRRLSRRASEPTPTSKHVRLQIRGAVP